jgi:SAM-dependent methyltransferase
MKNNLYVDPQNRTNLRLDAKLIDDDGNVLTGRLLGHQGQEYIIEDGVPDFTISIEKSKNEYAINLFKDKAKDYDKYQHLSFETFYEDEVLVRQSMISKLNLKNDSKVLEVNAGTGRDSILIAKHLDKSGMLHVQDISKDMIAVCKEKMKFIDIPFEIHQGNASRLPYLDQTFDAVYSFGGVGMNTYSSNRDALAELVRVVKVGGRIVFGGLSLAPWLRGTHFGKVLLNHNIHYANEITFSDFPVEARNLNLNWILGGAGFVVDFSVGAGEPSANFDFDIPGPRGGTLLTRYFGALEGVKPETKALALKAREMLGISMHSWLDDMVTREANKVLDKTKSE